MKRCLIMLPLTFLVWGCTVGPDYQRPVVATPKQWTETVKNRNTGLPDNHTSSILRDQWWQSFNDPILNRLITDAIAANLDLKQALVRVKDARAQRWVTITAGLPSITGKSNVSRRLNNSSASGQTGGTPGAVGGSGFGNQIINIFQSGFDAQWELDFFGGERRAIEPLTLMSTAP